MSNLRTVTKEAVEISAKTVLSCIPIGGALITNVSESVKSHCAQKRLSEWQNLLEERLSKIEVTLEDIGNNENFTSAIYQATEQAIRTGSKTKREYLANAVANSVSCDFEESVMIMFLDMIGKYTDWHLKILVFFQNPQEHSGKRPSDIFMGSPAHVLYDFYPELKTQEELVNKIVKELHADGVFSLDSLNTGMTGSGALAKRTTKLGDEFINFITQD